MADIFSTASILLETLVATCEKYPNGAASQDLRDYLRIPSGFDVGGKMYAVAAQGYVDKVKTGGKTSNNVYKINDKGRQRIRNFPQRVLHPDQIEYFPKGQKGGSRVRPPSPAPQAALALEEPVAYSKAAESVMDAIAPIIDKNQSFHTLIANILMMPAMKDLEGIEAIPKREGGLMEVISGVNIENATLNNLLVDMKEQLIAITGSEVDE